MNEKEIKNGKRIFFESDDDILEIWFSEKLNKFCRMFNAELKTWATFSPCLKDAKRLIDKYSLIEQIQPEINQIWQNVETGREFIIYSNDNDETFHCEYLESQIDGYPERWSMGSNWFKQKDVYVFVRECEEFEILVWYRYVIAGEQEKEYDIHKVAAVDVQDAVNKSKLLYPSRARIPFAFYHNEIKYQPQN